MDANTRGDTWFADNAFTIADIGARAALDIGATEALAAVTVRAIELGEARMKAEKRWKSGRRRTVRTVRNLLSGGRVRFERDDSETSQRCADQKTFYSLACYLGVERAREHKARTAFRAWHTTRQAAPLVAKEMARRGW